MQRGLVAGSVNAEEEAAAGAAASSARSEPVLEPKAVSLSPRSFATSATLFSLALAAATLGEAACGEPAWTSASPLPLRDTSTMSRGLDSLPLEGESGWTSSSGSRSTSQSSFPSIFLRVSLQTPLTPCASSPASSVDNDVADVASI